MVDIITAVSVALGIYLNNIIWVFIGVAVGMILGVIPGMGGVVTLTVLLPFTANMSKFPAFTLMAGAFTATTFAGSITAILINTPGTSSNAATLIDGYPMTQKGQSATAIGASAFASAAGALIATLIFIIAIPIMIKIALLFGPPEIFWLVLSALIIIPVVVGEKPLAGLMLAGFGALLSFIGRSPQTAELRFTFEQPGLFDGIPLLVPLVGLFALAEIFRLASLNQSTVVEEEIELTGNKFEGIREVIRHKWLFLRCSIIGLVVGAIPGAGGASSAFIAYGHAVQSARDKSGFGQGRIEGVIASEASNDAKDGGQLFPSLGLGIPGSGTMAVFLAALLMHGILPGPRLIVEHTSLVLIISFSVLTSSILTSIIGLVFTDGFLKILEIPVQRLLPAIAVLSLASAFVVRNNFFDVGLTLVFAAFGALLIYLNISRIPFLIAFILGSILETNYYLGISYASGDFVDGFLAGYLNQFLIVVLILTIIGLALPTARLQNLLSTRLGSLFTK